MNEARRRLCLWTVGGFAGSLAICYVAQLAGLQLSAMTFFFFVPGGSLGLGMLATGGLALGLAETHTDLNARIVLLAGALGIAAYFADFYMAYYRNVTDDTDFFIWYRYVTEQAPLRLLTRYGTRDQVFSPGSDGSIRGLLLLGGALFGGLIGPAVIRDEMHKPWPH